MAIARIKARPWGDLFDDSHSYSGAVAPGQVVDIEVSDIEDGDGSKGASDVVASYGGRTAVVLCSVRV